MKNKLYILLLIALLANLGLSSEPMLKMGWFDSLTAIKSLNEIKLANGDFIIGYSKTKELSAYKSMFIEAEKNNVSVILQIPVSLIKEKNLVDIENIIVTGNSYDSCYGWLLYDEPDNDKTVGASDLEEVYTLIKKISSKKVFLILRHPKTAHIYIPYCDVLLSDDYPIYLNSNKYGNIASEDYAGRIFKLSNICKEYKKEFGMVIQAFGEDSNGESQFKRRLPDSDELEALINVCILNNAQYIFAWTYYRTNQNWVNQTYTPVTNKIVEYYINNPLNQFEVVYKNNNYIISKSNDYYYVMNLSTKPIKYNEIVIQPFKIQLFRE